MSDEFREDVKAAVRKNDPSAEDLRTLAADLERLAEKFETTDAVL